MIMNQQFWNSMQSMKSDWKTNRMPMGQIWYMKNPYMNGTVTTMMDLRKTLVTFGQKSVVSDSIQVRHRWYMDDDIVKLFEEGDFRDEDEVFVVNRTWFYQDYNNQNAYYPTKMLHFLNVVPNQTHICQDLWLSINHSEWYPKKEDYGNDIEGFQTMVLDGNRREMVVLRVDAFKGT